MTKVTMTVNGKAVSGDVEGRTLLSSFLRDDQGMTGTHVGCDTSQCGACVVHVNGVAVKSCTMLAAEADGASVDTIEGQANADGSLNVIQQAFQDHHGLQCGFCTPGFVVATHAALDRKPDATLDGIRYELSGNLCRCGTYPHVFEAARAAQAKRSGAPREGK